MTTEKTYALSTCINFMDFTGKERGKTCTSPCTGRRRKAKEDGGAE